MTSEAFEERRAHGLTLMEEVRMELKVEVDVCVRALLVVKYRVMNRLYGLDTTLPTNEGAVLALRDVINLLNEEIRMKREAEL